MAKNPTPRSARPATLELPERALHQRMEALRIKLAGNQTASIDFLQRAGILDNKGKLIKPYRR